jgi:hypothetical protein
MRAPEADPESDAERGGLHGLPEERGRLGTPAAVHGVRSRRLLRQFEEQARPSALPRDEALNHPVVRTRRELDVVLRGRPVHFGLITENGMATESVKDAAGTVLGSIESSPDGSQVLRDASGKIKGYYDPTTDHTRGPDKNILAKGNVLRSLIC